MEKHSQQLINKQTQNINPLLRQSSLIGDTLSYLIQEEEKNHVNLQVAMRRKIKMEVEA